MKQFYMNSQEDSSKFKNKLYQERPMEVVNRENIIMMKESLHESH
jgi:hypothetical protein